MTICQLLTLYQLRCLIWNFSRIFGPIFSARICSCVSHWFRRQKALSTSSNVDSTPLTFDFNSAHCPRTLTQCTPTSSCTLQIHCFVASHTLVTSRLRFPDVDVALSPERLRSAMSREAGTNRRLCVRSEARNAAYTLVTSAGSAVPADLLRTRKLQVK